MDNNICSSDAYTYLADAGGKFCFKQHLKKTSNSNLISDQAAQLNVQ